MTGRVHVIGAGLAGLAAAVRLAEQGRAVTLHESAPAAGGRCRSLWDARLGMLLDNGNHLLLSGNRAALDYLDRIGGRAAMEAPPEAEYAFADLASGEGWTLRLGRGRWPGWIADPDARVPGSRPADYLAGLRLFLPRRGCVGAAPTGRPVLDRALWRPVLLAALNCEPAEGSAALAARVLRQTFGGGGAACRPMTAAEGLSAAFVDPALAHLRRLGATLRTGHRLLAIESTGGRVQTLRFHGDAETLGPDDSVVLAVPPWVAAGLLPWLTVPTEFRAIDNIHFATDAAHLPRLTGLVGGTAEWLFAFPGRLSVTISDAGRLSGIAAPELAARIWAEIAPLARGGPEPPPHRVIRERRATFAATPGQESRRPGPRTALKNLVLAGDWTATGLPASIEGAILSGETAVRALSRHRADSRTGNVSTGGQTIATN